MKAERLKGEIPPQKRLLAHIGLDRELKLATLLRKHMAFTVHGPTSISYAGN